MEELARRGIVLEVCPGSNVALGLYPNRAAHPLHRLIAAGVRVTLGSDDPPFFHTTLGTEYDKAGLGEAALRTITRTAIEASFADEATKAKLLKGIAAMIARKILALGAIAVAVRSGSRPGAGAAAQRPAAGDAVDAALGRVQGQCAHRLALAQIRLDQALADKSWTAAPGEQKGDFANLPPAVVLDVDETVLDNSLYQVWMLKNNQTFSTKTWNEFCAAQISRAIPGAVEFTKYADSKGVKVFYITNRGVETEKDTRENMEKLGFPMGGNVDTFLMQSEQPDWGSAKSTRRAVITKDYRVLLNFGDNFGDFDDRYRTSEAERAEGLRREQGALGPRVAGARQPDLRLVRERAVRPRLQEVARRAAQGQVGRAGRLGRAQAAPVS